MGFVFRSRADTEVIAHLIAHHLEEQIRLGGTSGDIDTCLKAVNVTLDRLKGTYGLGILFRDCPDTIIDARSGSPLVIGIGKGECFLASDASPLVGHAKEVVYLADT